MFKCLSIKGRGAIILGLCFLTFLSVTLVPKAVATFSAPAKVPIIMYHSILKEKSRQGDYVISPQVLENDMKYLKDKGYTAILVSELVKIVTKGGDMPEKPIIITFDDGHLNNLTYALPILQKYGMKGVVSIVGSYSEGYSAGTDHNPLYAYLTWADIKTLEDSDVVEIANHSYDMHHASPRHGTLKIKGESDEAYRKTLMDDAGKTQKLLSENSRVTPTTFTYPFGKVSKESIDILKEMGFTALLTCNDKVNYITTTEDLYSLGRFNRPSGIGTYEFMKKCNID